MRRLAFVLSLVAAFGCRSELYPESVLPSADLARAASTDLRGVESAGNIGDPCKIAEGQFGPGTCSEDRMICRTNGYPGGYCVQPCKAGEADDCPAGAACNFVTPGQDMCMKTCATDLDCREGYFCDVQFKFCDRVPQPPG